MLNNPNREEEENLQHSDVKSRRAQRLKSVAYVSTKSGRKEAPRDTNKAEGVQGCMQSDVSELGHHLIGLEV